MPKVQPNNDDNIAKCVERLNGLNKHLPDLEMTIDVNGKSYTVAQIKAMYQDELDVRAEIRTQTGRLKSLLAKRARVHAQRLAADRGLKPWVVNKVRREEHAGARVRLPAREGHRHDHRREAARRRAAEGDAGGAKDDGEAAEGED
jgi:hypothetical protein